MKKVIVYKAPTIGPLPGGITDARVHAAILPVQIETARRNIAACTELPQLLRYKDQAEGLAAAVRVMREVGPEMAKAANAMVVDAWRKGGELLLLYNGKGNTHSGKAPRTIAAQKAGIPAAEAKAMTRFAAAPRTAADSAAFRSRNLRIASTFLPKRTSHGRPAYSEWYRGIMGAEGKPGLTQAASVVRRLPLESLARLSVDEKKIVRAIVVEMLEILDEMERRCK